MKVIYVILTISILCSLKTKAQSADTGSIKATIIQFFDGMRNSDTASINPLIFKGARLETVGVDKNGEVVVKSQTFEGFLSQIATPHTEIYDERITFSAIHVDGNLATAWTPYEFYLGQKFSHSGVNAFQLVKNREGKWQIYSIIDTRRKRP